MAEAVWAASRERFLVLLGIVLTGRGSRDCWAEAVQRETREVPDLDQII